jgi:hypothetical protein
MASGHVNRTIRPNTWPQSTKAQYVQKVLANREPSTHGTYGKWQRAEFKSGSGRFAEVLVGRLVCIPAARSASPADELRADVPLNVLLKIPAKIFVGLGAEWSARDSPRAALKARSGQRGIPPVQPSASAIEGRRVPV